VISYQCKAAGPQLNMSNPFQLHVFTNAIWFAISKFTALVFLGCPSSTVSVYNCARTGEDCSRIYTIYLQICKYNAFRCFAPCCRSRVIRELTYALNFFRALSTVLHSIWKTLRFGLIFIPKKKYKARYAGNCLQTVVLLVAKICAFSVIRYICTLGNLQYSVRESINPLNKPSTLRWHGPALLQPGLPGGNKKPPGLDCLC